VRCTAVTENNAIVLKQQENATRNASIINVHNISIIYIIYFYTNRIVLAWNSLGDTVVTAPSVNSFRKQLNTVNLEKFLIVG